MKKIISLLILITFLLSFPSLPGEVKAGAGDNVSGWAWSETIGWISFNSINTGGAIDYGVSVDLDPASSTAGDFTGYAWSENIGWIKFNQPLFAIPDNWPGSPGGPARLSLVTNEVSGWSRACAGTVNGDCDSESRTDGWDGWIKMRCNGTECTTSNYGVSLNATSNEFEGWAWGSDVVGWMSFNKVNCDADNNGFVDVACGGDNSTTPISDYKVFIVNLPPLAINLAVTNPADYCGFPNPPITLNWEFSDPDIGDTQSAYQVQVDDNSDFSSPEVDSCDPTVSPNTCDGSASTSFAPFGSPYDNTGIDHFGKTYYWQVKVWDSADPPTPSDWIVYQDNVSPPESFTTSPRPPLPNFTCNGLDDCLAVENLPGTIVILEDTSIFYGGAVFSSRLWTLPSEATLEPGFTNLDSPIEVTFTTGDNLPVTLQVTDSNGSSCSTTENLNVTYFLPEWKEIPPVGLLERFLASIFQFFRV